MRVQSCSYQLDYELLFVCVCMTTYDACDACAACAFVIHSHERQTERERERIGSRSDDDERSECARV